MNILAWKWAYNTSKYDPLKLTLKIRSNKEVHICKMKKKEDFGKIKQMKKKYEVAYFKKKKLKWKYIYAAVD